MAALHIQATLHGLPEYAGPPGKPGLPRARPWTATNKGKRRCKAELGQILFSTGTLWSWCADLLWVARHTLCRSYGKPCSPHTLLTHSPNHPYRDIRIHKHSCSPARGQRSAPQALVLRTTLRQKHTRRTKHSCRLLLCNQSCLSNILDRLEGETPQRWTGGTTITKSYFKKPFLGLVFAENLPGPGTEKVWEKQCGIGHGPQPRQGEGENGENRADR